MARAAVNIVLCQSDRISFHIFSQCLVEVSLANEAKARWTFLNRDAGNYDLLVFIVVEPIAYLYFRFHIGLSTEKAVSTKNKNKIQQVV